VKLENRRLNNTIDQVEIEIKRMVSNFWLQFSDDDLHKITDGDPAAIADCVAKGGERVSWIAFKILMPEDLEKILRGAEAEINKRKHSKRIQKYEKSS
jgi:hypothetical protein